MDRDPDVSIGSPGRTVSMPIPKELQRKLSALDCAEDLPMDPVTAPAEPRYTEPSHILDLYSVVHRHIHLVLDLNHGNKLKSARQLGISRSTLYRLLEGEVTSTSEPQ